MGNKSYSLSLLGEGWGGVSRIYARGLMTSWKKQ
jgi:hypothetical protein